MRWADNWIVGNWVLKTQIAEQLEVDELEEWNIKLKESSHDFVVDIEGQSLVELVRLHPRDVLSHDLNTVVDTLDWEESLGKVLSDGAVEHKVFVEVLACL